MEELTSKYPVVITQELLWRDMDAYQHINNAVYFRYFEDARIAYFGKAGIEEHMKATGVGPILASTRCDFRAPLTFPDSIQIATVVSEVLFGPRCLVGFAVSDGRGLAFIPKIPHAPLGKPLIEVHAVGKSLSAFLELESQGVHAASRAC